MNTISRRHFLQATAAGTLAITQMPTVIRGAEDDKKLKLGLIGCGWYGMVDAKAALKAGGVEVVALCDVDSEHLEQSAAELEKLQGKRPKTFKLYEDLLKLPELEALIIATPPHWHALQLIAAARARAGCVLRKAARYDVREGRAMVDAVKKSGRIVQVGFQRRQNAAIQAVRQRIQAGDAGRIVCAEAKIHYTAGTKDPTPQPPPASLDWDLWCGPGPKIPYSPQVGHMNWRLEKTSGHGPPGGLGHPSDRCRAGDPGRRHAHRGDRRGRPLLSERPHHHAGCADRPLRIRKLPVDLAAPDLGRRGIRSGHSPTASSSTAKRRRSSSPTTAGKSFRAARTRKSRCTKRRPTPACCT